MKTIVISLLLLSSFYLQTFGQKAILLHHSTGGAVYYQGGVSDKISAYNSDHSTNFIVDEFNYPDNPYDWKNYPYDFWNLWVNGECNSSQSGIECLESILSRYDVIVFKHCFPGANIGDDGNPQISSENKTIANYKLQYRALRNKFDQNPSKKFVVWTLAPQHRNATNAEEAARAREFVNWVKNDWLTEDGNAHPNIFVFDFYNIVAEGNPTPSDGEVNCLKYDYEGDHDGDDGHPNEAANLVAGEAFANFMIQIFTNQEFTEVTSFEKDQLEVYFDSKQDYIIVNSVNSEEYRLTISGMDGRIFCSNKIITADNYIDISTLSKGFYLIQVISDTGSKKSLKIFKGK